MYKILLTIHSTFRFLVLFVLASAVIKSFFQWIKGKPYSKADYRINLLAFIGAHTQLLIGLALYLVSPYVALRDISSAMSIRTERYWTMEHGPMMLVAILLISTGYAKSKKALLSATKHKQICSMYGIGLLLIVITILLSGRGLFTTQIWHI